jgi:hypothetical protein
LSDGARAMMRIPDAGAIGAGRGAVPARPASLTMAAKTAATAAQRRPQAGLRGLRHALRGKARLMKTHLGSLSVCKPGEVCLARAVPRRPAVAVHQAVVEILVRPAGHCRGRLRRRARGTRRLGGPGMAVDETIIVAAVRHCRRSRCVGMEDDPNGLIIHIQPIRFTP